MNEEMKKAWAEITEMLGEPTREELDVFLRAWQRAMEAHKQALAVQPAQQEPVAWVCEGSSFDEKHGIDYWPGDVDDLPIGTPLYTPPPAQRTWVGLTDEEVDDFLSALWPVGAGAGELLRAIEAKLKEKNT